jgi:hypothetical protein
VVVHGTEIAAGTKLVAQLDQPLGSGVSHPGDRYTAHLVQPILDASNHQVVPAGSIVEGHVTELRSGGLNKPAAINLTVDHLRAGSVEAPIAAHIAAADVEAPHKGINLNYLLGGGFGGAVLGAVIGGTTGALLGGALGAGAGTLISLGTTGHEAKLPAGTALAVELDRPVPLSALKSRGSQSLR